MQRRLNWRIAIPLLALIALAWATISATKGFVIIDGWISAVLAGALCLLLFYLFPAGQTISWKAHILLGGLVFMALLPLFLNGFYYGDDYWLFAPSSTTEIMFHLAISMKRPALAVIQQLFASTTIDGMPLFRFINTLPIIAFGCVLYRFVLEKSQSPAMAFLFSSFCCCGCIVVDCIGYASIFPVGYALLLSSLAYISLEKACADCARPLILGTWLLISAAILFTAFCFYQISTPVFFLFLAVSLAFQKKTKLFRIVFFLVFYGIVALCYLKGADLLQAHYHASDLQAARGQFIGSVDALQQKMDWFFELALPQSVNRIAALFFGNSVFTTNSMFYEIRYQHHWVGQIMAVLFWAGVIAFFVNMIVLERRIVNGLACIVLIPASFYPFIILPDNTYLTYYALSLIMLLLFYTLSGYRLLFRMLQLDKIKVTLKRSALIAFSLLIVMQSYAYAQTFWVNYNRDGYRYLESAIMDQLSEDKRGIHVIGTLSPHVGGNPYVVFAVKRILEGQGIEQNYAITQTDNQFYTSYIDLKLYDRLKKGLTPSDFARLMTYYSYSDEYSYYYYHGGSNSPEVLLFLQKCFGTVGAIPASQDDTVWVSLNGFNQTHSF